MGYVLRYKIQYNGTQFKIEISNGKIRVGNTFFRIRHGREIRNSVVSGYRVVFL